MTKLCRKLKCPTDPPSALNAFLLDVRFLSLKISVPKVEATITALTRVFAVDSPHYTFRAVYWKRISKGVQVYTNYLKVKPIKNEVFSLSLFSCAVIGLVLVKS